MDEIRRANTYTEDFIAAALVLLEVNGYPHTLGAMKKTSEALDVAYSTLRAWAKSSRRDHEHRNATRDRIKSDIIDLLGAGSLTLFREALRDREELTAYQKVVGGAIMADKLETLTGGRTQNIKVEILHKLDEARPPWMLSQAAPAPDEEETIDALAVVVQDVDK